MALAESTCVSERHEQATAAGKLTAGQMAARLNRVFKTDPKIKAAELKPFAVEWHHSGFIPGKTYGGSHMGRTYFFGPNTDRALLYDSVMAARMESAQIEAEPIVTRYFFSAGFEKLHRANRWDPKWRVYAVIEAVECKASDFFGKKTEISQADFEAMKRYDGSDLEAYESWDGFKHRMGAEHGSAV